MDWYPKRRFGDLADEIADRLPDAEGLVRATVTRSESEVAPSRAANGAEK
jgi:hypothetical protein